MTTTLIWTDGHHMRSSDVHSHAAAGRFGRYHVRSHEGGHTLTFEAWRDGSGGAIPIQHHMLGVHPTLEAARAAAVKHCAEWQS